MLLSLTFSAEAQQTKKVPLFGYVSVGDPQNPGTRIEAFRQRLHDLGYTEGKNILVDYRYLHGRLRADSECCV